MSATGVLFLFMSGKCQIIYLFFVKEFLRSSFMPEQRHLPVGVLQENDIDVYVRLDLPATIVKKVTLA